MTSAAGEELVGPVPCGAGPLSQESLVSKQDMMSLLKEHPAEPYPDPGLHEALEIARRVQEDGCVLIRSSVLDDRVVYYKTSADLKKVPTGFVPYGDDELRTLYGTENQPSTAALRLIHAAKKIGGGRIVNRRKDYATAQSDASTVAAAVSNTQEGITIDFNEESRQALHIMEHTHGNIFITGRAGTGKSTLLGHFTRTTTKKVAVLAPTGIAALNVGGQTIHSFFEFSPTVTLATITGHSGSRSAALYKKLDAIVIDEISMVRADWLDCVDKFMRLNGPDSGKPFGGVQMIFIGDLYQLPPVVSRDDKAAFESVYRTPYFYGATVFDSIQMEFVDLTTVYRQRDAQFIGLLNAVRDGSIGDEGLKIFNQRYLPHFEPPPGEFFVRLTTTNAIAERVNNKKLSELNGEAQVFSARVDGDFGREYVPAPIELRVKPGTQVMLLNNDPAGRWVNGTVGEVVRIAMNDVSGHHIEVKLDDGGTTVEVDPFTWKTSRLSALGGQLHSDVVGTFTQYPLMLAWAVTIHKAQGKTLDKAIIDFGRGTFMPGQAYVALSRCTSLEGIVLAQPLLKRDIKTDFEVAEFLARYENKGRTGESTIPPDHISTEENEGQNHGT